MNFRLGAILLAATAVALAGPAAAAPKHQGKRYAAQAGCVEQRSQFSWDFLWATGNKPRANGCAPAVYQGNRYIGQDPDPNIRLQMMRDPAEGDLSAIR